MSQLRGFSPGLRAAAVGVAVAGFVSRHARVVTAVWFVLFFVVLGGFGQNIEKELEIHPPIVKGTEAARVHEIGLHAFGNDYPLIVLLKGPQRAVRQQGEELARRLRAIPPTIAVSPWDGGAVVGDLNPRPGVAALLVRTGSREGDKLSGLLPPLQRQIDRTVRSPVRASVAGVPVVIDSLHNGLTSAARMGQLIAGPLLLIVLLFVFRTPLAALTPLLVGGSVVSATRGVLNLLQHFVEIDLFVLGISAMMGLALGVDYSLLVVSRFREERKKAELPEAIAATAQAASRSILPAGGALLLGMAIAPLVLPSLFVRSVAIGVSIGAVLSIVSAFCVVPALLTLFGRHLDRWELPFRRRDRRRSAWRQRLIARPGAVIGLTVALLALSVVALGLDTGIATTGLLAAGDPGRVQQEEVEDALGPGWVSPSEVLVHGAGTPVTSPSRLKAIAEFQRHVERDPGVASVAGLAPIERGSRQLAGFETGLAKQEEGLDQLEAGIAAVGEGAARNTEGLVKAAQGSKGLDAGAGTAKAGAGALLAGLQATRDGSGRLFEGLGKVDEGSGQLAEGTSKVSTGADQLSRGLAKAAEKTSEVQGNARVFKNAMRSGQDRLGGVREPLHSAETQLTAARQALQRMTAGRGDAEYAAALAAVEAASRSLTGTDPGTGESDGSYEGVAAGIDRAEGQFEVGEYLATQMDKNGKLASEGLEKLADGSSRLDRGLRRLVAGSQRLSDGVAALTAGGEQLSPGLRRLSQGAERLSGGLGLLEGGAGRLSSGLSEGAEKSRALPRGLRRMGSALESGRKGANGESRLAVLQRRSPGVFRSAYFVLAALDGSRPTQRSQIGSLIDLDRGGMDARVLVIPKDPPGSDAAQQTTARLQADADQLAQQTGSEVLVGGVGPVNMDIIDQLESQALLMRLAMALVGLLILIPLLRSLLVPLFATAINLLTISATFGVMALLFNGSLLGGPGYIDATTIPSTIMLIFGLAIDYEVFVFARIREEYVRTGSTDHAVGLGIERTAPVVTGAAVIMITVFLSFSVSGLMSMRNFGVAQAIAVSIDAFVVRLVIVPALMLWLGDRCWWMPSWLSRRGIPSRRSPVPQD